MENNFNFFRDGDTLLVESDRLLETIDFVKQNNIKKIMLNSYHGFKNKNILFATEVSDYIEELEIIDEKIDLTGLDKLVRLKKILFRDELNQTVDLSVLPELEYCNMLWHKNIHGISRCKKLKRLVVINANLVEYNFFAEFKNAPLESLDLTQGKIVNLDFLKHLPNLLELELAYLPKLKDISGLVVHCPNLKKLRINHCKNIEDFTFIGELKKLEYLDVSENKIIPNIHFIKGLPLRHFTFVDTNIEDGDLILCENINYVGFSNKKHYTHKFIGIKEGILIK